MIGSNVNERIEIIDVLRGIAILGILLVNMAHFSYPDLYLSFLGKDNFFTEKWSDVDHFVRTLLDIFVQMKFIFLFSFLFGFSMVLMMDRILAKGKKFVPVYLRRLLALLLFGIIHAFFIWDGDILMDYALLGFILIFFRKVRAKTLIIWAISFYLLFTLFFGLASFQFDTTQSDQSFQEEMKGEATKALDVYANGSILEIQEQRLKDRIYYMTLNGMITLNPIIYFFSTLPFFSMFLLGMAFAKGKVFTVNRKKLKGTFIAGLFIGLLANILYSIKGEEFYMLIGAPFLTLFYIVSFTYLFEHSSMKKWLAPFSAVGRTAFTNYIMQSVICTFIFYQYGLGLYGKVFPLVGLFITIGIFIIQLIISNLWLKRFRMGPLEWLWRTFTYLQRQPMVKKMPSSVSRTI